MPEQLEKSESEFPDFETFVRLVNRGPDIKSKDEYITHYLWDVITCPMILPLAQHSLIASDGNSIHHDTASNWSEQNVSRLAAKQRIIFC